MTPPLTWEDEGCARKMLKIALKIMSTYISQEWLRDERGTTVHTAAEGPGESGHSSEGLVAGHGQAFLTMPVLSKYFKPVKAKVCKKLNTWNTYIEFFKLPLNFTVHFSSKKVWIPNRKCFNKQQGSIRSNFRVSGLQHKSTSESQTHNIQYSQTILLLSQSIYLQTKNKPFSWPHFY